MSNKYDSVREDIDKLEPFHACAFLFAHVNKTSRLCLLQRWFYARRPKEFISCTRKGITYILRIK